MPAQQNARRTPLAQHGNGDRGIQLDDQPAPAVARRPARPPHGVDSASELLRVYMRRPCRTPRRVRATVCHTPRRRIKRSLELGRERALCRPRGGGSDDGDGGATSARGGFLGRMHSRRRSACGTSDVYTAAAPSSHASVCNKSGATGRARSACASGKMCSASSSSASTEGFTRAGRSPTVEKEGVREAADDRLYLTRARATPTAKRADRIPQGHIPSGRQPQGVMVQSVSEHVLLAGVIVHL